MVLYNLRIQTKVRLGENAYNNGKILQEEAMQRAEDALAFSNNAL